MFKADSVMPHWSHWFFWHRPPWANGVWLLSDGQWAASDGRIGVVFRGQGEAVFTSPKEETKTKFMAMLTAPAKHSKIFSRDEIVALFGACIHPQMQVCSKCKGVGESHHYCDCNMCTAEMEQCPQCEGTKIEEVEPDTRHRRVWGQGFNANYVAYLLAHTPAAKSYTLELVELQDKNYLRVTTEEWQGVIAPMENPPYGDQEGDELIHEQSAETPLKPTKTATLTCQAQ